MWKWQKGEGLCYEDVFRKLHEKKIKYLLIGGVAVNLYGVQRATGDLDLMLAMDKNNILKFISVADELGLKPKVPVKTEELADPVKIKMWQKEKNMKVFSFMHLDNSYITIDIMTENYIPFKEAYKRRKKISAWGLDLSIISIEDLIKLKRIAGRKQDLSDIEALKKFGGKT